MRVLWLKNVFRWFYTGHEFFRQQLRHLLRFWAVSLSVSDQQHSLSIRSQPGNREAPTDTKAEAIFSHLARSPWMSKVLSKVNLRPPSPDRRKANHFSQTSAHPQLAVELMCHFIQASNAYQNDRKHETNFRRDVFQGEFLTLFPPVSIFPLEKSPCIFPRICLWMGSTNRRMTLYPVTFAVGFHFCLD